MTDTPKTCCSQCVHFDPPFCKDWNCTCHSVDTVERKIHELVDAAHDVRKYHTDDGSTEMVEAIFADKLRTTLTSYTDQKVREERERALAVLSEKKHHGSIKWKYVKQALTPQS